MSCITSCTNSTIKKEKVSDVHYKCIIPRIKEYFMDEKNLNSKPEQYTVPGKSKLTVSFESRIETRSSILEDGASMIELGFESFESSMETRKNRESNELVA